MPFPSALPLGRKLVDNNTSSGGGGSRDVEWLMFSPNPINESSIAVCARLGGLAAVGGLESWFWTLQKYVLTSGNFRLHAVNLEALHWIEPSLDRFYFARSAVARILESNSRLNIGPDEIIDECDVVLSSWVDPPLRPPPGHPRFKSILIIHGSDAIEREGTWLYGHQLNVYDATVCVSAGCMGAYGPSFQKQQNSKNKKDDDGGGQIPLQYIPSSIDLAKYDPSADMTHARAAFNLPTGNGKKVLGFLGRIAEDKNPQLFVDVVSKLPKNWVGAMAGPLYLPEQQIVSNLTSRIYRIGNVQEPWKFLAAIDALYVPSKEEGGPIVLLEAWAMGKPFFMRRTGLAVEHEDGVFVVPEDSTADAIATFIDEKINKISNGQSGEYSEEVEEKIQYGLKTVREQFSTDVVRAKYHTLMSQLLKNEGKDGTNQPTRLQFQVHYPKGQPPSEEAVQLTRRGRTLWARCFYKQCLFFVKFSPQETSKESTTSSTKVYVVMRTFSAPAAAPDGEVAGYLRGEKGTEKLATIAANTRYQSINLNLSTNVFAVQLFSGQAIQILDVLSAA